MNFSILTLAVYYVYIYRGVSEFSSFFSFKIRQSSIQFNQVQSIMNSLLRNWAFISSSYLLVYKIELFISLSLYSYCVMGKYIELSGYPHLSDFSLCNFKTIMSYIFYYILYPRIHFTQSVLPLTSYTTVAILKLQSNNSVLFTRQFKLDPEFKKYDRI